MRASLADDASFNHSPTNQARFAGALVDPEMVLEIPTAVHPVDACPIALDPLRQSLADCSQ